MLLIPFSLARLQSANRPGLKPIPQHALDEKAQRDFPLDRYQLEPLVDGAVDFDQFVSPFHR
jgi:hypothetical protein